MDEKKLSLAIEMMVKTDHRHRQLIDSCVKDIGVPHTQHRILMTLAREKKLPSQKELAERLKITPAAVTLAIKGIERDGYIERRLGKDTRFNEISITEKGRALVKLTREKFFGADSSLFEDFTDEELDVYIKCLSKMQNNIEATIKKGKVGQ